MHLAMLCASLPFPSLPFTSFVHLAMLCAVFSFFGIIHSNVIDIMDRFGVAIANACNNSKKMNFLARKVRLETYFSSLKPIIEKEERI